jgi:hypothetical protein
MTEPEAAPLEDPVVRRVLGLVLLILAMTIAVAGAWLMGHGEVAPAVMVLIVGPAGGLGGAGVSLLLWPMGRQRR